MGEYKIFKNPLDQMDAVKQGWSWPGFLFGPFWALFNKMWIMGGGLLVLWCLPIGLNPDNMANLLSADTMFVTIVLWGTFGTVGNAMRAQRLISMGYEEVGKVEGASTPEGAIAIYVKQRKNPQ